MGNDPSTLFPRNSSLRNSGGINTTMNLLTIHIGSNHECAAAYIYYNTTTIYAGKKDYASYKHLKIRVLQTIIADVKKA